MLKRGLVQDIATSEINVLTLISGTLVRCIFLYINQTNSTEGDLVQDSAKGEINVLTLSGTQ